MQPETVEARVWKPSNKWPVGSSGRLSLISGLLHRLLMFTQDGRLHGAGKYHIATVSLWRNPRSLRFFWLCGNYVYSAFPFGPTRSMFKCLLATSQAWHVWMYLTKAYTTLVTPHGQYLHTVEFRDAVFWKNPLRHTRKDLWIGRLPRPLKS